MNVTRLHEACILPQIGHFSIIRGGWDGTITLYPSPPSSSAERRQRSARGSRLIAKLRGHGPIARVKDSRLYRSAFAVYLVPFVLIDLVAVEANLAWST